MTEFWILVSVGVLFMLGAVSVLLLKSEILISSYLMIFS